jgi:hypothetical protein
MEKEQIEAHDLRIKISDLNLHPDGPCCMSFGFDLKILKRSISRFGIINAPYLIKNKGGSYSVVAGYKRLLAAKELGWEDVECKVFPANFPAYNALLFNLEDNLLHRELNIIEKAMVIERLSNFLDNDKIIAEYLPLFHIPVTRNNLILLLNLNELEESVKVSVAKEIISLKVVDLIRSIDREDRLSINSLFNYFRFSFNQQLQLFQYIEEISKREGRRIKDVVEGTEIQTIIADMNMNNPQKVKAITATLKNRRFPALSGAQKAFKKGVDRLSLPSGVSIAPPPFFEGVEYRLEIAFTSGKELANKIQKLNNIPELSNIASFWKGREDT